MKESERIAGKWNEFLIEAQKSPNAYVYIINYIICLIDPLAKRNNLTFDEMIDKLKKLHKEGLWRDFLQ